MGYKGGGSARIRQRFSLRRGVMAAYGSSTGQSWVCAFTSLIVRKPKLGAAKPLPNDWQALAVEPIAVPIHGFADIERAVTALADQQNSGFFFPSDLTTVPLRDEIVPLIARHRLPAIYS